MGTTKTFLLLSFQKSRPLRETEYTSCSRCPWCYASLYTTSHTRWHFS